MSGSRALGVVYDSYCKEPLDMALLVILTAMPCFKVL